MSPLFFTEKHLHSVFSPSNVRYMHLLYMQSIILRNDYSYLFMIYWSFSFVEVGTIDLKVWWFVVHIDFDKSSSTSFTLVVLINIWIRVVSCKYQYCIYMYNLSCNVHISIKEHFTVCFYKWILKYQCTPFYEQFNCRNL